MKKFLAVSAIAVMAAGGAMAQAQGGAAAGGGAGAGAGAAAGCGVQCAASVAAAGDVRCACSSARHRLCLLRRSLGAAAAGLTEGVFEPRACHAEGNGEASRLLFALN